MVNRRYILTWAGALLLALAVTAAINFAVDPFDVFGMPRVAGFNATKPWASEHTYLAKSHQLRRQQPVTVIFGTSRADIGLDPLAAAWPAAYGPVYNFGLPGSEVFGMERALEQTVANGTPKNAIILLEVEALFGALPSDERWHAPSQGDRLRDALQSMLTMSALETSIGTLLTQHRTDNPDLTAQGATTESGFRRDAGADGFGELFAQKNREYLPAAQRIAARWAAQPDPAKFGPGSPTLRKVGEILALCRARGIHPIILIAPSHADRLETFSRLGLWPAVEAVKRSLAVLGPGVQVWDFMGYDPETTEPVPPIGDRTAQMHWFWEPAHFQRRLGDLMLRRVFGEPGSFGVLLTPATVTQRLQQVRDAQQQYRHSRAAGSPGINN